MQVHHEYPDTYADTWEDCLLRVEDDIIENAQTARDWYGFPGDAMLAISDRTDGPITRVRVLNVDSRTRDERFPRGSRYRLKPDDDGLFEVKRYHEGQGVSDCVLMFGVVTDIDSVASVEKWVPRELKDDLFPIGRRFGLHRIEEGV